VSPALHAGESRPVCATIRIARDSVRAVRVRRRRTRRAPVATSARSRNPVARPNCRTNVWGSSWPAHSGGSRAGRNSQTSPAIGLVGQRLSVVLVVEGLLTVELVVLRDVPVVVGYVVVVEESVVLVLLVVGCVAVVEVVEVVVVGA
jgi:hypothetical protein